MGKCLFRTRKKRFLWYQPWYEIGLGFDKSIKPLIFLVAREGLEPPTPRNMIPCCSKD